MISIGEYQISFRAVRLIEWQGEIDNPEADKGYPERVWGVRVVLENGDVFQNCIASEDEARSWWESTVDAMEAAGY